MNFCANVKKNSDKLARPQQKAELTEHTLSDRLGKPLKNTIEKTRLGNGYGLPSDSHCAKEAAIISQKRYASIKLV